MSAIPNVFIGRNTGSLSVAGITIGSDGTITVGTARSALAVFTSVKIMQEKELENISAASSYSANMVPIERKTSYEIGGFLLANDSTATPTNYMNSIYQNFDFAQVVLNRGGLTWTGQGVFKGYDETIDGKGKVVFTLQLDHIDNGGANPAQS